MTEEESLEQQTEATPATQPTARAPADKKPTPLIFIAVALLLLLLIVGAVLYFLLLAGGDQELTIAGVEDKEYIAEYLKRKQSEDSLFKLRDEEPRFTRQFTYTVNLADGKHMLKITWKAMMYDQTAIDYLMARKLVIDDNIASMLSKWMAEELKTRSGLELLKREIYKELNSIFEQPFIEQSESKDRSPVKRILITEFFIN